jgi:hypothetical protein
MVYLEDDDEADVSSFYHDVMVDGCNINLYILNTDRVRLSDNRLLSRDDVIELINAEIT